MKKNKRKLAGIFVLLFTGVLLTGIVSCSRLEKNGHENQERTTQKRKVAMITKSTTSAFFKSVYSGANAASTAYNMELLFEGPDNEEDYQTQNEMIGKAVEEGYEAIVLSAADYNANAEAIDEAAEAGVKIIVIDSDVNSDNVLCRLGTDNYNAGCVAGEAVLAPDEEKLNIGIVNFERNTENGQERERGFRDIVEKDSRVGLVETINVLSTIEDAKEGTWKLLKKYPQINAIVTFNEWTSLGVGYAIQEKELGEKLHVVAFDSNIVSVGMLESGEVDALIVQNPYAMGYLGVESAYKLLNGISVKKGKVDTSVMCVTRENMYDDECQKALFAFETIK